MGEAHRCIFENPRACDGSVIPPNREFLALVGDNRREPEVVSPLSTIRQAVSEALAISGGRASEHNGGFGGGRQGTGARDLPVGAGRIGAVGHEPDEPIPIRIRADKR